MNIEQSPMAHQKLYQQQSNTYQLALSLYAWDTPKSTTSLQSMASLIALHTRLSVVRPGITETKSEANLYSLDRVASLATRPCSQSATAQKTGLAQEEVGCGGSLHVIHIPPHEVVTQSQLSDNPTDCLLKIPLVWCTTSTKLHRFGAGRDG